MADDQVSTDPTGISDSLLLHLAQQAGIVAPSDAPAAPSPTTPSTPTTADDDQHESASGFARGLGYNTSPQGDVSVVPPPASPGLTTGASRSSSSSSQGVNMAKMKANDAYIDPSIRKAAQGADAEANAAYAPGIQAVQDAHAQGAKAIAASTSAESAGILAQGREDRLMGDIYTKAASDEARINEQYRGESNQAKADYMASLADFRSQRVDPQALWKSMGTGNQLGMLVSAFVQDFLGVKGIHVSAMDTFNKAVDRNIDAQVQNIKNKGEVTQGFKTLWDMQRAQSASDAEARTRVRGFMIDGAKQATLSHMAQYKAALSDAQGQAALAKLDDEFAKNLVDVYKHIDTSSIQRREQAIQVFGEKLKAATEANRTASAERIAKMEHPAVMQSPTEGALVDPWTGKYAYKLTDSYNNVKPEDRAKFLKDAQEKLNSSKTLDDKFNEMRTLVRESAPLIASKQADTRFVSTFQQKYQNLKQEIAQELTRATDGRVNWNEIEGQMKGLPNDLIAQGYDLDQVIADKQKLVMGKSHDYLQGVVTDLDADHPARAERPSIGGGLDAARRAADAGSTPVEPTHDEKMLEGAAKATDNAYTPGYKLVENPPTNVKDLVKDYANQHPANYAKTDFFGSEESTPEKYKRNPGEGVNVTISEKGLVDLYDTAAKGGKTGDGARKRLEAEASEYLSARGSEDSSPESVFAAYLLSKLHDHDPDRFPDPEAGSPRHESQAYEVHQTAQDK